MRRRSRILASTAALLLAACGTRRAAGVLAPGEPVQHAVDGEPLAVERDGYRITPLASYSIEALVLSKESYFMDREADLAPEDLALGWGPMSDPAVVHRLDIGQGFRAWHWQCERLPLPARDIDLHAANVHCIPAGDDVRRALGRIGEGDVVRLSGYLVQVDAEDGWRWRSSLSRHDTGSGACELLLVEDAEVVDPG